MTDPASFTRKISCALCVFTAVMMLLLMLAVGVFGGIVGLTHWLTPEKPRHFGPALWLGLLMLLPGWWLIRFYFVMMGRAASAGYAKAGWAVSACFHAALTWMFGFYMKGTIHISPEGISVPMVLLSAAACGVSGYLLYMAIREPIRELP